MQYTRQCFCGNSFGSLGKGEDSTCNKVCQDQEKNTCGGGWRNNVYLSNTGPKEARCACPSDRPIWDSEEFKCVAVCPQ